jgi:predicted DNA-binding protein
LITYKYNKQIIKENIVTGYTFDLPPSDVLDKFSNPTPLPSYEPEPPLALHQTSNYEPDTRTVTLRMPGPMVDRLDSLAANGGISRSHVLRQIATLVLDSIKNDPDIGDYNVQVARLYQRARELVLSEGYVSAALLQRHLRIDYHIALLLIDELEKTHTVTPPDEEGRRILTLQKLIANAKSGSWYESRHS